MLVPIYMGGVTSGSTDRALSNLALSGSYNGTSNLGIIFPNEMHRLMLVIPKIRIVKPKAENCIK